MAEAGPPVEPSPQRRPPLPSWVYLLISFGLSLIPLLALVLGGAKWVKKTALDTAYDLYLIQPMNLVPAYLDHLRACDYLVVADHYNCSPWRYANPMRVIGALIETAGDIIARNGASVAMVMILSLILGFWLALAAVKRLFRADEADLILVVIAAFLAPVVASIAALGLKWVAIGLSYFVAFLALVILSIGRFLWEGWKYLRKAKDVTEDAETLGRLHARFWPGAGKG
jgi:hypothetical protein